MPQKPEGQAFGYLFTESMAAQAKKAHFSLDTAIISLILYVIHLAAGQVRAAEEKKG